MRRMRLVSTFTVLVAAAASLMSLLPALAGERVLSINSGTANHIWEIKGEPSLVINGFDLTPLGIGRPATIDRVTLAVDTPVAGAEVVIYEDGNGGSPADATLIRREPVTFSASGSQTITLSEPATINAPVVWVGFYLPVGFKFLADESGSSVLTYWGWNPGGTVDVTNLASVSVFGPADGRAPVNIDMGGKARITAEITGASGAAGTPVVLSSAQSAGNVDNANLGVLGPYAECPDITHDTADEFISYENKVNLHCRVLEPFLAPTVPGGYQRAGRLYDVSVYDSFGNPVGEPNQLEVRITHCITPYGTDIEHAVVGLAFGSPRTWRILTSQRFGGIVCAEIPRAGLISYFLPSGVTPALPPAPTAAPEGQAPPAEDAGAGPNANLVAGNIRLDPEQPTCQQTFQVQVDIANLGSQDTSATGTFTVQDMRDGQVVEETQGSIPIVRAGETVGSANIPITVDAFFNEEHVIVVVLNPDGSIPETGNSDNRAETRYTLQRGGC